MYSTVSALADTAACTHATNCPVLEVYTSISWFSLVVPLESVLQRPDDPREALDYSYQRQLESLTKVRRGVADVATSVKRIELQVAAKVEAFRVQKETLKATYTAAEASQSVREAFALTGTDTDDPEALEADASARGASNCSSSCGVSASRAA